MFLGNIMTMHWFGGIHFCDTPIFLHFCFGVLCFFPRRSPSISSKKCVVERFSDPKLVEALLNYLSFLQHMVVLSYHICVLFSFSWITSNSIVNHQNPNTMNIMRATPINNWLWVKSLVPLVPKNSWFSWRIPQNMVISKGTLPITIWDDSWRVPQVSHLPRLAAMVAIDIFATKKMPERVRNVENDEVNII